MTEATPEPKRFELWMLSNAGFGLAYNAVLPVLLPAYVLAVGGTPTDVGVAMAMVGLFALAGPTIGNFAARYAVYRHVQALGVLGFAIGFAILALAAGDSFMIVLGVGAIGLGAAALLVVSPAFIVGAGLDAQAQARQLTFLQLNLDAGKILGGAGLTAMASANFGFEAQFWVTAGALGALAVAVWLVNGTAHRRIVAARERDAEVGQETGERVGLRALFGSLFGLVLLAMFLATVMSTFISSQYSNIFMAVFELGDEQISAMVSVSGLVGISLYFVAGAWLGKGDPVAVWAFGNAIRGIGGLLLAVLGAVGGAPYVAILGSYLLVESCAAFARIAQAPTAVRFAPVGAAVATGWIAASAAFGQASGSIGAGLLADATGSFEVLLWVAGGFGVAAGLIGFLFLLPASRRDGSTGPTAGTTDAHAAGQAEIAR